MKKYVVLCALIYLILQPSYSQAANIFACEEPKGMRVDWGDVYNLDEDKIQSLENGPQWNEDGFSNITPVIIIEDNRLLLNWGNTRPDDLKHLLPEDNKFKIIPISGQTMDTVWGILQKNATVEIIRYYRDNNLLFRLTSSIGFSGKTGVGLPANASIMISKCKEVTYE